MTEGNRLGGNEEIIRSDRFAALFETSSNQAVSTIGRRVERQDFEGTENCSELRGKARRPFLFGAVTQFSGNNNAGADLPFADLSNALRYPAVRIAHEVGDYVGIE